MKPHRMNPVGLTGTVSCRDRTHKVDFNARGQIVLLDHDRVSRTREIGWEILGGDPCGCRAFVQTWNRHCSTMQMPPAFPLPPGWIPYYVDCGARHAGGD